MAKTYRFGTGNRLVNSVFSRMSRFGRGAPYLHTLTVRGRRTGQPRSVPVDVMDMGDKTYLVAPYGVGNWVRNVRASPQVTLSRGGQSRTYGAEEVGPEEAVPVLRKYMAEVPVTRAYFDATPDSSNDEIAAELPSHPVFGLVPELRA